MEAIRIERLSKSFESGRKALDEINLRIGEGEMVALIGASGSGKSTLLRQIAGFTASDPQPSRIDILGRPIQQDGRIVREVRRIRRDIGFVFQQFNLVHRLTVETNVLIGALSRLPLWRRLTGRFPRAERELMLAALGEVGIAHKAAERASNLSGGQQQRAALARALVQRARLILADEPIASLDPESSRRVMDMLRMLNRDHSLTVVVSLHQVDIAMQYCPRTVALREGRVVYDGPSAALTPALLQQLYGSAARELLEPDAAPSAVQRFGAQPRAA
ncbi:phosphonate ABC transporter ATP-binding protein [Paraburkholderia unamae]|uniref:Phosphonate transport system ATP-binding protein n=1 Tax=Paraburkholderia unamae TaxID=219649 RepID=A0ABX5KJE7_9BURK|nr:phosphonate ABC transporter ATP-binding protein [Paraburkholderia unamae]PVX78828.1 phosphonate transport system ATP-binding protein [Paraburkholderia unamae]RAR65107.1 phosphonate transport system ATP-binding protein [Paraburkholderia unamae]CAG9251246.1 phosphonate ABC transporter ATP binding subunit [Paraburkholderia unamae]